MMFARSMKTERRFVMSAYLCDQATINAIATFAADHDIVTAGQARAFADLLTLQNVRSMQARYPGREWLKADVIDVAATYRYERVEAPAANIARAADEYDYQACETDDYQSTLCKRLVDRVQVLATAIAELER